MIIPSYLILIMLSVMEIFKNPNSTYPYLYYASLCKNNIFMSIKIRSFYLYQDDSTSYSKTVVLLLSYSIAMSL